MLKRRKNCRRSFALVHAIKVSTYWIFFYFFVKKLSRRSCFVGMKVILYMPIIAPNENKIVVVGIFFMRLVDLSSVF